MELSTVDGDQINGNVKNDLYQTWHDMIEVGIAKSLLVWPVARHAE